MCGPLLAKFGGGVANCPLGGVILQYAERSLGSNLLSVVWSSRVSILEELQMYGSLEENNWDTEICPL